MSGKTISTSETKAEALKLQSSAQGVTIPAVFGVNKVAGNLLWYAGLKAIPKTETQGGKGGGGASNTTYTYKVDAIMGVCHGPITDIPRVWVGKKLYDGGISTSQIQTAYNEQYAVPSSGAMTHTLANAAGYKTVLEVTEGLGSGDNGISYLAYGVDYVVSPAGVLTVLLDIWRDRTIKISYQYTIGTESRSGLAELGLSFVKGSIGQSIWSGLAGYPSGPAGQQLGYSGLAYVAGQGYQIGSNASLENHNFEVVGKMAYHLGPTVPDVDLSLVFKTVITDTVYGANFPSSNIGDWSDWSDFCVAAGILVSPAFVIQTAASELLAEAAEATNTGIIWSDGKLKAIPYGDQPESKYGRTYTPKLDPVYDIDDDCCILEDGQDAPIRYARRDPAQRFNHYRIEYLDRANGYNVAIAEHEDLADIEENGRRSADIIQMHWICEGAIARKIAQMKCQRSLSVRSEYFFQLPWHFGMLECMDILALVDPTIGLDRAPTLITEITEAEDGELQITVEDYPIGSASPADFDHEYPDGYSPDYNLPPGNALAPVVFEAPTLLTLTGLEVYIAVAGEDENWGGAHVWVSVDGDGTNYKLVGTVESRARYGVLTANLAATSGTFAQVLLASDTQLTSGTEGDAAALQTLVYFGGPAPEYCAHEAVTLTGPRAYNVGSLHRGLYGTPPGTHSTGDDFVRVDDNIVKSGPLDLDFIGKELWIKITSFNIYGAAEQSLAEVDEYRYLVTGYMAKLPPSMPTGGTYIIEEFGIRLICAKNPEPDVVCYVWRAGTVWATAKHLEDNGGTSYPWRVQLVGDFRVWVAAQDKFGNLSAPLQIDGTVPGAGIVSLIPSFVGDQIQLDYVTEPGAFNVDRVQIRYGNTFSSATVVSGATLTRYTQKANWTGTRRWWAVAIDVAGNYGEEQSVDVTVVNPGAVQTFRSEVVDNNVLLYWQPPTTGTLPVVKYDVRRGTTFSGSVQVGSNADSTFAVVFEQLGGQYTYWVVPYDSAGNQGSALSITATVNQPPDYVLRVDWDSTFSGTKTNLYIEDGSMIGPINTTQTFATHFTGNSWATPQDQVDAGFPLYIEPGLSSGSYEEIFDYGAVLPATTITVTLSKASIAGSVTIACQIYYKKLSGDPWTAAPAGFVALGTQFRYVRVILSLSCTAGANLVKISGINVKLASKQRNDSGTGTVTNATTGVVMTFGYPFIDADTPIVQPAGTTPLIPVVDYVDVPNPTTFTVYLYTTAGVKTTGDFSWTVRGY